MTTLVTHLLHIQNKLRLHIIETCLRSTSTLLSIRLAVDLVIDTTSHTPPPLPHPPKKGKIRGGGGWGGSRQTNYLVLRWNIEPHSIWLQVLIWLVSFFRICNSCRLGPAIGVKGAHMASKWIEHQKDAICITMHILLRWMKVLTSIKEFLWLHSFQIFNYSYVFFASSFSSFK